MNDNQTTSAKALSSTTLLPDQPLPLRHTVRCLLGGCGIIAMITLWTVHQARAQFPPWFRPVFFIGMILFLALIGFYLWVIHRPTPITSSDRGAGTKWIWLLAILSVICTSSLHGFAPFRPDIFREWSQLPSSLKFIKYNYILTGLGLLAVTALALLHLRGCRQLASAGLLVLAGVMLLPNDDCTNAFNRPWIARLGASPLGSLANSVVLLIGYCGLQGIRPRLSAGLMGIVNAGVLLLGLGHMTQLIW